MNIWPFRRNEQPKQPTDKFQTKSSRQTDDWTRIGGYSHGTSDVENVPRWVRYKVRELDNTLTDAAIAGRYLELNGKNYRHRLVPTGHGAPTLNVFRRRRSGR